MFLGKSISSGVRPGPLNKMQAVVYGLSSIVLGHFTLVMLTLKKILVVRERKLNCLQQVYNDSVLIRESNFRFPSTNLNSKV